MNIDAKNLIAGRLASFAAKQALLGEEVNIVNSEEAIVSGKMKKVLAAWKERKDIGSTRKGPFLPRMPDRLLKRIIRGMLPYSKARGKEAHKRIRCYLGIPKELEGKAFITIEGANVSKLPNREYVKIKDISKHLGSKA